MMNRYFYISKDSTALNNFENEIMPIINKAKFNSKEDKEKVINWSRKTFNNQWKQKGERR